MLPLIVLCIGASPLSLGAGRLTIYYMRASEMTYVPVTPTKLMKQYDVSVTLDPPTERGFTASGSFPKPHLATTKRIFDARWALIYRDSDAHVLRSYFFNAQGNLMESGGHLYEADGSTVRWLKSRLSCVL